MPKIQFINPDEVRKPQMLEFDSIPINQYDKTIEEEVDNFSRKISCEFTTTWWLFVSLKQC